MSDRALISAFRYGYGLGRAHATSSDELLAELRGGDKIADEFKTHTVEDAVEIYRNVRAANKELSQGLDGAKERRDQATRARSKVTLEGLRATLMRAVYTDAPFRERLVHFWADHFSVSAKGPRTRLLVVPMIDGAIRPNISGKFSDLLRAAVLDPAMLFYLDQQNSIGPNSVIGKRRSRGLNENLARELIELHTMGVNSAYTQNDIRELAELLTGIQFLPERGVIYKKRQSEPGSETVLGKTYDTDRQGRKAVDAFLEDISLRPETARHLAAKLVTHFVGEDALEALTPKMEEAYLGSGGNLSATYRALLQQDEAWRSLGSKIKTPFEYVVSGLRVLEIPKKRIKKLTRRDYRRFIFQPMQLMGQSLFEPPGPDGWPEEAEAWMTPATLAGRLQWAMQVADEVKTQIDPRELLGRAIGPDRGSSALRFAVQASENKQEAIAMVLASPEFNRR
ncbi:MAG: DUF1800 domain-containing protein [Pseudomonadota bacterium]